MHEMIEDINKALEVLRNGGIIVYPTETIWGIGCDATNEKAVSRIYAMKQRSDTKSMLVLIHNEALLSSYVEQVPDVAWDLLEAATDPLTIIYPGAKNLAKNLISEDLTIGIRVTTDPFCSELLSRFRKPIVSTSANTSGTRAPGNFSEIEDAILTQADYVVQWRQEDMTRSKPSSVIKLGLGGEFSILR